jgi:hypothetical protein
MTTPPTQSEQWDDERLAAAFAARAIRAATPIGLAGATTAAMRTRRASAVAWRRFLAAAAVVILAVGAVSGGIAVLGALRGSTAPDQFVEDPSAGPTPSPSPSDGWAGREAVGLPVISVSDALAIRDAGIDDREIAVHGWFPPIPMVRCPPQDRAKSPIQGMCEDAFTWLTEDRETLTTSNAAGMSTSGPVGPAINLDLDDLDSAWMPARPRVGPWFGVEIAVVGHFDDRRSTFCPAEEQDACRDRFVVDRVDWVNGETQPTSFVGYTVIGRTFQEAEAVIGVVRPGVTILSVVHVDGDVELPRIEPTFADRPSVEPTFADRPSDTVKEVGLWTLWIVRVLDDGALETYLFVDSTGDLYHLVGDRPELMAPVSGDPSVTPPATTVLGVPVISVPELIARRSEGPPSPDELAVRGWMIRSNEVYDCATYPDPHPLVPWCESPTFLMERPETVRGLTTDGPAVIPVLGPDASIEADILWQVPSEVIALGHLDDHRWRTCRPEGQDACRRQFVIDRIVRASAVVDAIPESWESTSGASPPRSLADLETSISLLEGRVGSFTVLSVGNIRAADLAPIEPQASEIGQSFADLPMWILRVLLQNDPSTPRTFLLTGAGTLEEPGIAWELTEDGPEELPPPPDPNEATPRPAAAASTPSPEGIAIVVLTSQVGRGRSPVRVTVVDRSGLLTLVREVRSSDPPFLGVTAAGNVFVASGGGTQIRLLWIGSVCDGPTTVTIGSGVAAIVVDVGTRQACDSMGVGRELVMTLSDLVDPASIDVTYVEHVIFD